MARKWTKEELTRLFELMIEASMPVVSHHTFRNRLSRDENLFTNQIVRVANGNIAYRSVDCDLLNMSDEDFWGFIDGSNYNDLIEDNAAVAILKMAEKLNLIN